MWEHKENHQFMAAKERNVMICIRHAPYRLDICTQSPVLVVLFGEVMEPLGYKVRSYWRKNIMGWSKLWEFMAFLPTSGLFPQLPALATSCRGSPGCLVSPSEAVPPPISGFWSWCLPSSIHCHSTPEWLTQDLRFLYRESPGGIAGTVCANSRQMAPMGFVCSPGVCDTSARQIGWHLEVGTRSCEKGEGNWFPGLVFVIAEQLPSSFRSSCFSVLGVPLIQLRL